MRDGEWRDVACAAKGVRCRLETQMHVPLARGPSGPRSVHRRLVTSCATQVSGFHDLSPSFGHVTVIRPETLVRSGKPALVVVLSAKIRQTLELSSGLNLVYLATQGVTLR